LLCGLLFNSTAHPDEQGNLKRQIDEAREQIAQSRRDAKKSADFAA
jgi:hypothetical protein